VVVVEHDMDFMRAFATSVTVLARGQVIAEGTVAEVQANPKVQEVYLGTAAAGTDPVDSPVAPLLPAGVPDELMEES
jgi:urea transport system ATP-binding protein